MSEDHSTVQPGASGVFSAVDSRPKFAYEFWHEHLQSLGFHLRAEVLKYPGDMPGDIGPILSWK